MPNKIASSTISKLAAALLLSVVAFASPQSGPNAETGQPQSIALTVPAGAPLRVYLTTRVPKRAHAAVEARLLTPLYAFDREVIPSGATVLGQVSRVDPVTKWERIRAVMGGDFTPLCVAQIEFTSLLLPDNHSLELHTVESPGLRTLVPLKPPKQRTQNAQAPNTGTIARAKQDARDQIDAQIARVRGIPELVRGTDKKEWLYDYAMSRLPYHPQSIHNRTRFDAVLRDPLSFGAATVTQDSMALVGTQPAAGSTVHARLLTPLDSLSSKQGEKVEAVLEQPLFGTGHRLILPEGTRVEGAVAMAKRAGWFHRPGRLRFSFQSIDLPPQVAALRFDTPGASPKVDQPAQDEPQPQLQLRTQATLNAAEGGTGPLKVDSEGGVQATESKTRFIGLAASVLIARAAGDNDRDHDHGVVTGQSSNVGGRTLGGGLGFGLLGTLIAQSSPYVGTALGYYGLAWNAYSTLVARGTEVEFGANAVIDIGFNQREATSEAAHRP